MIPIPQEHLPMNRRDALTTVALAGAAMAATTSVKADTAPTSTLERIKKSGVLRIAVIAGQDPYFHKDLSTNQWSGACIDMANDIAGKLGAKVDDHDLGIAEQAGEIVGLDRGISDDADG